ncbi:MAG: glycosyltransferase family 4 protein [bacterium]|nr:glycosyltransferase family 4 protein [bacterium]
MRVLHVNKFFDHQGGAEHYLHELLSVERAAGIETHVFSTRSEKNEPSVDQKYFVERFDLSKREGIWKDLKKARNFLWNGEARRSIARLIRDVQPDVIHLHNVYHHLSSSILGPVRAAGVPVVMTLHDYNLASPNYAMFDHQGVCEHGKGGHYFEIVKHRCVAPEWGANVLAAAEMKFTKARRAYEKTVDLFLCPSRFMQKKMEEWGEPSSQLRYLPNPTDLPTRSAIRGGGYLLFAGRLSREKGLASVIEAAAATGTAIKIAGKGPEEERLRHLAKEKNAKQVSFLGYLEKEEMERVRNHAEAIVLPTLSYENCSGALLEGMAHGLPCLATRIGGNPELVKDGENGFLVAPGDVNGWKHAFEQFSGLSETKREEMGVAGRQHIQKNHLWKTHLDRVLKSYADASKA